MDEDRVWPPPPLIDPVGPIDVPRPKPPFPWHLLGQTAVIGIALGIFDVHEANEIPTFLTMITSGVVCFRQPRYVLVWVVLLCATFFICHVGAILMGFKYPYVEQSLPGAVYTWVLVVPFGVSGLLGIGIRALTNRIRHRGID